MYGKARDKLDGRLYTQRTTYLLYPLDEFTEYFIQVYAETAVSGAASNIEKAETFEDGKCFHYCSFFSDYSDLLKFSNIVLYQATPLQILAKLRHGIWPSNSVKYKNNHSPFNVSN